MRAENEFETALANYTKCRGESIRYVKQRVELRIQVAVPNNTREQLYAKLLLLLLLLRRQDKNYIYISGSLSSNQ